MITLVNLVGGFAIGTLDRGMAPLDALRRYGLLSVGDGLVAQIPSIILAVGAGILVTRVAGEAAEQSLAKELIGQLFGLPKAMLVAGAFVALLGFVPGLPTIPFLVIGSLLLAAAALRERYREVDSGRRAEGQSRTSAEQRFTPQLVPLRLYVGQGYVRRTPLSSNSLSAKEIPELWNLLESLRHRVFQKSGICLPPCQFACDPSLAAHALRLEIRERSVFGNSHVERGPIESLGEELLAVLLGHAGSFLGLAETQALLDSLAEIEPVTVRQVVPKVIALPLLNEVLARLVDESVSIRDLAGILLAVSRVAGTEKSPYRLTELVRGELKQTLCYDLVQEGNLIRSVVLDPTLEDMIRMGITKSGAEQHLALSSAALSDLTSAIFRAVDDARQKVSRGLVLLSAPDIRRHARKLIEQTLPDTPVLAYTELPPELTIETVATATLFGLDTDD